MKIGILAYLLHAGRSYRAAGVSTYARNLLVHLPRVSPENQYFAYVGPDAPALDGVTSQVSRLPTQHPLVRIPVEQVVAPLSARRRSLDVLHGSVNVTPLATRIPSVVTVHDLAFLNLPDRFPAAKRLYLRVMVEQCVRRAAEVIAVSKNTRNDLIAHFDVVPDRITVVYSGVDKCFRPLPSQEVADFRGCRLDGRPYVLHVGTLEPRKNLDLLIRAFVSVRRELGLPHVLALVGGRGWMESKLFELVRHLRAEDKVHFAGYVDGAELPLWYNGADLFAYPSAYEGFGLPILEAMSCGVPTITSSSSALQELAGDACLTVETGSQEALQLAIARLLTENDVRQSLRQAGLRRAAGFTWSECARRTALVYRRAVQGR